MSAIDDLAGTLGVPAAKLSALADVPADAVTRLQTAVTTALTRQDTAVSEGIERSLKVIPAPLRGRARALLFPKGEQ